MEKMKSDLMGSGDPAMEANEKVLKEAQEELEALKVRAEQGGIVDDQKVKNLYEKIRAMKADQERMQGRG